VQQAIQQIHATTSHCVPEIILLATVCALFLMGPFAVSDAGDAPRGLRHRWGLLSLGALVVAWLVWLRGGPATASGGLLTADELVWYTRGVTLSAGILLVLILWNQVADYNSAEAHACLLTILTGTNLVAAANDLVVMFLALEMVSIPTYVILYLPRRDRGTGEAAIKYFLLSVFSSALVLYGMSWLYGVAGTTNFTGIAAAIDALSPGDGGKMSLFAIAFALLVAGLCFRITAVPFHFYAPDVFQGTIAANAAMLSFVPKVVGIIALLRLIPLSGATESLSQWIADGRWVPDQPARFLLAVLAVATMLVGNLLALRQRQLYRLMAYSSIAHAGYMLVGLAVGDVRPVAGTEAVLFYLVAYGLMTIGVFALVSGLGRVTAGGDGGAIRSIDELRGLSGSHPTIALLLAVCLFSLTGLPPTVGFLGKLNIFFAAWSAGTRTGTVLAIVLGINAAISAWYYLRLVALMFLEPASEADRAVVPVAWTAWLAGTACALATIVLFFDPQWLLSQIP
jgi:NADH-quinone oxidoreductase subunit N